jgi:penicillin-binding protein 2
MHQRDFSVAGGDTALTAIGQGDVLVTPLQMADFMAALANNGTVYRPRLVKDVEDRNGNVIKSYPVEVLRNVTFDPKWMPDLKAAMINVIDTGTAASVHRDDLKIAAKTGTAQVGTKTQPRQIAWLSGYLPADNPQYAFSVVIEGQASDNHGTGLDDGLLGGREAGAIAKDIFDTIYPPPGGKKTKEIALTTPGKTTDEAATPDDSNTPPAHADAKTPPAPTPSTSAPAAGAGASTTP